MGKNTKQNGDNKTSSASREQNKNKKSEEDSSVNSYGNDEKNCSLSDSKKLPRSSGKSENITNSGKVNFHQDAPNNPPNQHYYTQNQNEFEEERHYGGQNFDRQNYDSEQNLRGRQNYQNQGYRNQNYDSGRSYHQGQNEFENNQRYHQHNPGRSQNYGERYYGDESPRFSSGHDNLGRGFDSNNRSNSRERYEDYGGRGRSQLTPQPYPDRRGWVGDPIQYEETAESPHYRYDAGPRSSRFSRRDEDEYYFRENSRRSGPRDHRDYRDDDYEPRRNFRRPNEEAPNRNYRRG